MFFLQLNSIKHKWQTNCLPLNLPSMLSSFEEAEEFLPIQVKVQ
jgi:hypothetical protein